MMRVWMRVDMRMRMSVRMMVMMQRMAMDVRYHVVVVMVVMVRGNRCLRCSSRAMCVDGVRSLRQSSRILLILLLFQFFIDIHRRWRRTLAFATISVGRRRRTLHT